jgi:RNA polymerase sigma-70 factor (ECF subfamily)
MRLATSLSDVGRHEAFHEEQALLTPERTGDDPPPLEKLYRSHAARLRSFFARRTGREEAQDLVQETFLRVARLDQAAAAGIRKQEAYLGAVANNLLKDRARAAARRAVERHCPYEDLSFATADPHRLLEDRETVARLEKVLEQLGPRRRRIFLLHRLEHLTYAEIAAHTGMSVKGVKKQMAKALLQLRQGLDRS